MIAHLVTPDLATSIWTLVWHWGLGIGIIILLVGAGLVFKVRDCFYGAAIVAVALSIYGYGVADDAKLCNARLKEQVVKLHQSFTFTPKPTTWHW